MDGAMARVLASYQRGPGFETRYQSNIWVAFFIGSHPHPDGFSPGSSAFIPPCHAHV